MSKEELMRQLLNYYQSYKFCQNPILKKHIRKLELELAKRLEVDSL